MDTDDGDLLEKVIEYNKYLYYIMLKSSMGGADASEIVVSDAAPWWQILLRVLDVTVIVLLAGAVVMYVLHTYTKVFAKKAEIVVESQN